MSQAQAGINEQTLMQMPQPGMSMNMGQQQALQRLAAEQEALRRQMEELNDEFGKRGEMLGRLDKLGEEMKRVAEDLKRSRVNDETIKRQENILTRLLDAQKSVNRQEYSRKRQSEQGIDVVRRSPTLPDEGLGDDGGLSDLIKKALEEDYPRQYEKLIRAYFKSFQNQGADSENE
jgi:myosin heavy subunit